MNADSSGSRPGKRDHGNRKPERRRNPYHGRKDNREGQKGKPYIQNKDFYNHKNFSSNNVHLLWLIIVVGIWVVLAPLSFAYDINPVAPSGGRQLWASAEVRAGIMKWSDITSGGILILFASLSFSNKFKYGLWGCCVVGVWLNAAPLIFWSPSAASYLNDTFAGSLVLAMCLLSNKLPGLILSNKNKGSFIPEGWTYNPSSWNQRLFLTFGGLAGWLISRYLASYQLGYINTVWDPFFGDSTVKVLDSSLSLALPVSDAGLGSFVYTFEFLLGLSGGNSRWKYFPWLVFCFGILVIPLSIAHVLLVLSQPVVVGYWCTLCLTVAAVMLFLIPLGTDEIIAMGQCVLQQKKNGVSAWKAFWHGGGEQETQTSIPERRDQEKSFIQSAFAGMSFSFPLILSVLIGIWIAFSPAIFLEHLKSNSANLAYIGGLLAIVFAVIAMGEVLRRVRYFNILIGLALAVAVWFIDGSIAFKVSGLISGVALSALSIPMGKKKENYGAWNNYIS